MEHLEQIAGGSVPESSCSIVPAGQDAEAIGTEGNRSNCPFVLYSYAYQAA